MEPVRWIRLTYIRYLKGLDHPTPHQRGEAVAEACVTSSAKGKPDLVLVHSGWGEARCLRQVFPTTPLIVFPNFGGALALGYGFDSTWIAMTPTRLV